MSSSMDDEHDNDDDELHAFGSIPSRYAKRSSSGATTSASDLSQHSLFATEGGSSGTPFLGLITLHSDYTVPTSNQHYRSGSPPMDLNGAGALASTKSNSDDPLEPLPSRRRIFGPQVQRRYPSLTNSDRSTNTNGTDTSASEYPEYLHQYPPVSFHWANGSGISMQQKKHTPAVDDEAPATAAGATLLIAPPSPPERHRSISELTTPPPAPPDDDDTDQLEWRDLLSPLTRSITRKTSTQPSSSATGNGAINRKSHRQRSHSQRPLAAHETLHAQTLLLGFAFASIWSPSNLMAPNLSAVAATFDFSDTERDLYLGSYCALAMSVMSVPIGFGIGILADVYHRQRLFCATCISSSLAAFGTGLCQRYWQLLLLRLLNGGFMAGSVPVAFSLLGDLFAVNERNAASSGLTAMMGAGIIFGQVYSGMSGPRRGWQHPFYVSGCLTFVVGLLCTWLVEEPVRGGKEEVLQDMLKAGTRYERKLTWQSFWHAMRNNASNFIMLWQGFFSSLPWGIIFVFFNDFLSQEKGLSVPDATYLVLLFGIGCACGGIIGGYMGQKMLALSVSYLPLFMAATTLLSILPFMPLLNLPKLSVHNYFHKALAFLAGLIASVPSVNVRPCLINVNPPETRGASLTAANMLIQVGRGVGPSCITLMGSIFNVTRQASMNISLIVFWSVSAGQLVLLSKTLPKDQDAMQADLVAYAEQQMSGKAASNLFAPMQSADEISLEDRMSATAFDGTAVREAIDYVRQGLEEFRNELVSGSRFLPCDCGEDEEDFTDRQDDSDAEEEHNEDENIMRRRQLIWRQQRAQQSTAADDEDPPTETTPLV